MSLYPPEATSPCYLCGGSERVADAPCPRCTEASALRARVANLEKEWRLALGREVALMKDLKLAERALERVNVLAAAALDEAPDVCLYPETGCTCGALYP